MTQFTGAWALSDSASSRFTRFLILRSISYDPRKKLHKNSRESANGVVLLASLQALSIFYTAKLSRSNDDRWHTEDTQRTTIERIELSASLQARVSCFLYRSSTIHTRHRSRHSCRLYILFRFRAYQRSLQAPPPPRLFHRGTVILEDVDFSLYERVISLGSINHDVLRRACRLAFHDRFLLSLRPKYIGAILIFWKAGYACAMTLV